MLRTLAYLPGYFISTVATATAKFFLVSLLIRNVGAEEFGRWSLFEPVVIVLSQLALLGANFGLIKQISQDKLSPSAAVKSLSIAVQPVLAAAIILILVISGRLGLEWPGPLYLALLLSAETIYLLLFASYRATSSIMGFTVSAVLKVLAMLVVLGLALRYGWPTVRKAEDVILWSFWPSLAGVGAGLLAVRLAPSGAFFAPGRLSPSVWRTYFDAVKYGLPLLITAFLTMVIDYAGRYILNLHVDHATLANYVVYAKISSMLELLVVTPFGIWWPTERFRELEARDGGRSFFRIVSAGLLALLLAAGGGLWILSERVILWFAPGVPFNRSVILLLLIATAARGMSYPLNIGALKAGKTHWNIYSVLAAAVINLLLSFMLIPSHGLIGAACATMLSYFCYTVFLALISQRLHPVPFPYLTMLVLIVISLLLLIAIQRFLTGLPVFPKAIAYSTLSLALCAPLVWMLVRGKHAA
ncbi:MAG: hypothetical protein A2V99_03560 [Spirochaetes bacterium RBG_16_67_19]|nr:MAG: hypothetical protein A2V99_03560 [Spirochaetes bacterium RBG_16_67_19]